jgi:uncharacterized protein (TIGR02679 family)
MTQPGDRDPLDGRSTSRPGRRDRPGLAPLWDELHRRFGDGRTPTAITLKDLTFDQRRAVADLLGSDRLPDRTTRIVVERLTRALHVQDIDALRAHVEEHRGPIPDRRAERHADSQARQELWDWLASAALDVTRGYGDAAPNALVAWVDGVRAAGVPAGDLAAHRSRLEQAVRVLRSLPAESATLAGTADDLLGDPHALDAGRPVARLVLDAVADLLGRERPSDAEGARLLWEAVGVAPDPLSSTVLVLGLRWPSDQSSGNPLCGWLDDLALAGEPAALTLAQLRRWPLPALSPDAVGYVVENPSLLAEAAAQPWAGPPLVCSSGRPTVAVLTLLRQLGAGGAVLRQHADFDRGGLGITAWLAERAGTIPWRMSSDEYLAAVATARPRPPLSRPLPATPWDPNLRPSLESHGVAVQEEEVRSALLAAIAATT